MLKQKLVGIWRSLRSGEHLTKSPALSYLSGEFKKGGSRGTPTMDPLFLSQERYGGKRQRGEPSCLLAASCHGTPLVGMAPSPCGFAGLSGTYRHFAL